MKCEAKWNGQMSFQSHIREHMIVMDAKKEHGGQNLGPSPKELVLSGIVGCTAMDVVSLLKKFKEPFSECVVSAETSLTQGHPVMFQEVHLLFDLKGTSEMKKEQLIKAVDLSMTKYCGVSAMIAKACPIYYKVNLNGSEIHSGQAFSEGS